MYVFNGIDLSAKYVKPSTWRWIKDCEYDFDAPLSCHVYDRGQGAIIWTYSSEPESPGFPEELRTIINTAMERDWRFIVIDCDGADCELFDDYSEEWDEWEKTLFPESLRTFPIGPEVHKKSPKVP